MIVQTSITLPAELVAELDQRAPRPEERSALVAEALRCFFITHRSTNDELKILDHHAEELNREAEDILDYQVIPKGNIKGHPSYFLPLSYLQPDIQLRSSTMTASPFRSRLP